MLTEIVVISDQTYLYDFSYKKRVDYLANLFSKRLHAESRVEVFGYKASKTETNFDKAKVSNFTCSSMLFGRISAFIYSALRYNPPQENSRFLLVENLLSALPLLLARKVRFHLDLHGDVVDELRTLNPRAPNIIFWILRYLERKILLKASSISVCSENHKVIISFILGKDYKSVEVIPNISFTREEAYKTHYTDEEFHEFRRNKKVIVYAGSGLSWQRPEDMLCFFKMASNEINELRFLILTNDINNFNKLINKVGLQKSTVMVKSVLHEHIRFYYENSDFGLIFRDFSTTNLVASPTKLVEYALMGLPIIASGHLGDFIRNNQNASGLIYFDVISDKNIKDVVKIIRSSSGLRFKYKIIKSESGENG